MQRALSSTDVGKGLVLGLAVAFMGLLADHLRVKGARHRGRDVSSTQRGEGEPLLPARH